MSQPPRDFREWMRKVDRELTEAKRNGQAAVASQIQREIDKVVDEIAAVGDPRTPAAPIELVVQSSILPDWNGKPVGYIHLDFPDVTKATDATPMEMQSYEMWGRRIDNVVQGQEPPALELMATSGTSTLTRGAVRPGATYEVAARAIGKNAIRPGLMSETKQVVIVADEVPPPIPSALNLTQKYSVVTATWDGLPSGVGEQMPEDFEYTEYRLRLPDGIFIVTGDRLLGAGSFYDSNAPYNVAVYYSHRAVDSSGNKSGWSIESAITVTPLVDEESIKEALRLASERIEEVSLELDATGAELDSRLNTAASDLAASNVRLTTAEGTVANLNDTVIPALASDLTAAKAILDPLPGKISAAEAAIGVEKGRLDTLNNTTIPGLNAKITAEKGRLDTLTTTTLPALQGEVNTAKDDLTNAFGQLDTVDSRVATAKTAAINAAALTAQNKADAAKQAAIDAAALVAQAKVDTAKAATLTAAATTAQEKADAAEAEAVAAAKTATDLAAAGAKQEAIDAAAIVAQQKATAAQTAAISAAATAADSKVATAKAATLTEAAATAQTKATQALTDAKADATTKANKALADAKADAVIKVEAAKQAAIAAAAADATSKAEAAEAAAAQTAAADAQEKADAAQAAAILAAQTYADTEASGAGADALAAAKLDATQKADAAKAAAILAAAADATSKTETAEANAAADAKTKADKALADAKLDATAKSSAAQTAAINAAAITAQNKADAAEQAAIDAAALVAQSKVDVAKAATLTAAATTAQEKATAAQTAAVAAAKTATDLAAAGAKQEAIDAAAIVAQQKATAAQTAAVNAAALTAQAKADTAKSEAISAAATTAQTKADKALADAKLDATSKANAAEQAAKDASVSTITQPTGAGGEKIFRNVLQWSQRGQSLPGLLVIQTPITMAQKMTRVSISGYNYRAGSANIDLSVDFYAYSGTSFISTGYSNKGSMPLTVRLGLNSATNTVVIIIKSEDPSNVWNYPAVNIDQVGISHTVAPDSWANGWSASLVAEADLATGRTAIVTMPRHDDTVAAAAALQAAAQALIDAKADATAKANAAELAAKNAAALVAQAKADTAKSEAIAAAATTAQSKADTAKAQAIAAAETYADQEAAGASAAALALAKDDATTKANAAKAAAEAAAAITAQAKVDTAKAAALVEAANDATGKANAAQAAAIQAAAEDATTKAGQAQTNAEAAATTMTNGIGKNLSSTSAPTTGNLAPKGSVWRRTGANNTIIGVWEQTGAGITGTWTPRLITSDVVDNIDIGKLSASTAVMNQAVIDKLAVNVATVIKLNASAINAGTIDTARLNATEIAASVATVISLNADRITAGTINTARLNATEVAAAVATVIQLNASRITAGTIATARLNATEIAASVATIINLNADRITAGTINTARLNTVAIAAATASIQTVDVKNLFATAATMDSAVVDKLWAEVVNAKKITTDMLYVGSGSNIMPWNPRVEDPAKELPGIAAYASTGNQITRVVGGGVGGGNYIMLNADWVTPGSNTLTWQFTNVSFDSVSGGDPGFPVTPGKEYVFETYIYAGGSYATYPDVHAQMYFYGSDGSYVTSVSGPASQIAWSWQKRTVNAVAPANAAYARVYMRQNQPGYVKVDLPSFKEMVDASLIVDGGIIAQHITASEALTAKVASFLKVSTGMLEANAVKADNIDAGAVTGVKLAAQSVTAEKMVIGTGSNIIPNSQLTSSAGWPGWGRNSSNGPDGQPSIWGLGRKNLLSDPFPVDGGKKYKFTVSALGQYAGSRIYVQLNTNGTNPNPYAISNETLATTWKTFEGEVTMPAGATTATINVYLNHPNGSHTTGYQWFTNWSMASMVDGSLIVNGSIDGKLIIGADIRSTSSPANTGGVQVYSGGIRAWAPGGGDMTFNLNSATGNLLATGNFQTARSGRRAILSDNGNTAALDFFTGVGTVHGAFYTTEQTVPNTIMRHYNSTTEYSYGIAFTPNGMYLQSGLGYSDFFQAIGSLLYSPAIYDRGYTASGNVVITSNGILGRSTSKRANKLAIEDIPADRDDAILSLKARTWFDKTESEEFAENEHRKHKGKPLRDSEGHPLHPTPDQLRRIPGMVAEEVEAAGLKEFLQYGPDGEVEGLMYERLGTALIPVVARLRDRIVALEGEKEAAAEREAATEKRLKRLEDMFEALENSKPSPKGK